MELVGCMLRKRDKTILVSYFCVDCENGPTYNLKRVTKKERKNMLADTKRLFRIIILESLLKR